MNAIDLLLFRSRLGLTEFLEGIDYFRCLEYPLVLDNLRPKKGDRILEIGSGHINLIPLYLASKRKYELFAVDSKETDEATRNGLEKIISKLKLNDQTKAKKFVIERGDGRSLKYPDDFFDKVYCVSAIEHIPAPGDSEVMAEIGRVLKSGGRCVITFPFIHENHIEYEEWLGSEYSQRHYDQYSVRERIIIPSKLKFEKAVHFGEVFPQMGRAWIRAPKLLKSALGWLISALSPLFWKVYYTHEGDEFRIDPHKDLGKAGALCMVLKKESRRKY